MTISVQGLGLGEYLYKILCRCGGVKKTVLKCRNGHIATFFFSFNIAKCSLLKLARCVFFCVCKDKHFSEFQSARDHTQHKERQQKQHNTLGHETPPPQTSPRTARLPLPSFASSVAALARSPERTGERASR